MFGTVVLFALSAAVGTYHVTDNALTQKYDLPKKEVVSMKESTVKKEPTIFGFKIEKVEPK